MGPLRPALAARSCGIGHGTGSHTARSVASSARPIGVEAPFRLPTKAATRPVRHSARKSHTASWSACLQGRPEVAEHEGCAGEQRWMARQLAPTRHVPRRFPAWNPIGAAAIGRRSRGRAGRLPRSPPAASAKSFATRVAAARATFARFDASGGSLREAPRARGGGGAECARRSCGLR